MSPFKNRDSGTREVHNPDVELIEIYINGLSYGINIAKVLRVIAQSECKITPMANSHECLAGLTHIDDNPVPVIDLSRLLAGKPIELEQERRLLLVLEFNKRISAYLIDGVNKIHRTAASNYKQTQATGGSKSNYVNGTVRMDDHVIQFLDIEQLLCELLPDEREDNYEFSRDKSLMENRSLCEIVLVEDSPLIRKRTFKGLQAAGFKKIQLLECGLQALNHMKTLRDSDPEAFERTVLITDVEMPEMDGITLCRTLKESFDKSVRLSVIVYSSLINALMRRRCEQAKADAIVGKPDINGLVEQIDALLTAQARNAA